MVCLSIWEYTPFRSFPFLPTSFKFCRMLVYLQKHGKAVLCTGAQSCPTLCDPMDCSPPGSSVHEILQARILEWLNMPSSRDGKTSPSSYFNTETKKMYFQFQMRNWIQFPYEAWNEKNIRIKEMTSISLPALFLTQITEQQWIVFTLQCQNLAFGRICDLSWVWKQNWAHSYQNHLRMLPPPSILYLHYSIL